MEMRSVLLIMAFAVCFTELDAQSKNQTLVPRDSDHALIFQKLDDLQHHDKGWLVPETLIPLILGLGGWVLAISTLRSSRASERERQQLEQLFSALQWFHGGTQRRSVGIAVIDGSRRKHAAEMGEIWTGVLVNQVNHILTRSANVRSRVERTNLERMVSLLTEPPLKGYVQADQRQTLQEAFMAASVDPGKASTRKGVLIERPYRDRCIKAFS